MIYCFFFNDTATTEIYTLSLHDALPIWSCTRKRAPFVLIPAPRPARLRVRSPDAPSEPSGRAGSPSTPASACRSEEHTSELQSLAYLVCRLLLEKKKKCRATHHRRACLL